MTSRARTIADFGDGIATADIDDGAVTAGKLNSTLDLTGKTVTLPAYELAQAPQIVSYSAETTSRSSNAYFTLHTFSALAAGYWKFTIYASVTSSVTAKIALFYDVQAIGASSGYTAETNGLFAEGIIESDGVQDATFAFGRNDDGGSTTITAIQVLGVKIG